MTLKNKLILEKGGRYGAVMRFMPPLNITHEDLDLLLTIFERVIKEVDALYV